MHMCAGDQIDEEPTSSATIKAVRYASGLSVQSSVPHSANTAPRAHDAAEDAPLIMGALHIRWCTCRTGNGHEA